MKLQELITEMKKPAWEKARKLKQSEFLDSDTHKQISKLLYRIRSLEDSFEKELDKLRPGAIGSGYKPTQKMAMARMDELRNEIGDLKQHAIDLTKGTFDQAKMDRILDKLIALEDKKSNFRKWVEAEVNIRDRKKYLQYLKDNKKFITSVGEGNF